MSTTAKLLSASLEDDEKNTLRLGTLSRVGDVTCEEEAWRPLMATAPVGERGDDIAEEEVWRLLLLWLRERWNVALLLK